MIEGDQRRIGQEHGEPRHLPFSSRAILPSRTFDFGLSNRDDAQGRCGSCLDEMKALGWSMDGCRSRFGGAGPGKCDPRTIGAESDVTTGIRALRPQPSDRKIRSMRGGGGTVRSLLPIRCSAPLMFATAPPFFARGQLANSEVLLTSYWVPAPAEQRERALHRVPGKLGIPLLTPRRGSFPSRSQRLDNRSSPQPPTAYLIVP